jgi:hypothetical protein
MTPEISLFECLQEPAPPHVTKDTCPAGSPGYEETAGGLLPPEPKGLSSIAWRFSQLLASITGSPSTLTYEGSKGGFTSSHALTSHPSTSQLPQSWPAAVVVPFPCALAVDAWILLCQGCIPPQRSTEQSFLCNRSPEPRLLLLVVVPCR